MKRLQTKSVTYEEFVEKFKPKKTTDDCYTPPAVYDAVAEWVAKEYNLSRNNFCRPFYPGGDYEAEDYTGKVVVDNPPFSIITKIVRWYMKHNVKFFLFAPTLTLFACAKDVCPCYIVIGESITYENDAKVNTSFVTNLDYFKVRTAPDLKGTLKEIMKKGKRDIEKVNYPPRVTNAASLAKYADKPWGVTNARYIRTINDKGKIKSIYGGGMLFGVDDWEKIIS